MSEIPESSQAQNDPMHDAVDGDPADGGHPAVGVESPSTEHAAAPAESRLSRKAAWLAMGAVALALALIWIAPGVDHVDQSATTESGGSPGEPEDAAAVGKPA